MDIKACLKTIRISPRKVRLVVNIIRNKKVGEAISILHNINKRSSSVIQKLIKSAISNAINNYKITVDQLFIKQIVVNEGKTMKRMAPRAHGRAYEILKRTSHINIIISNNINK